MSFLCSVLLPSWVYFYKKLILKALENTHTVKPCLLNNFSLKFNCKHLFLCTRYEQKFHRIVDSLSFLSQSKKYGPQVYVFLPFASIKK